MGHVIVLSELGRTRPTRLRGPLPEGGATISLFMGVRYERAGQAQAGPAERAALLKQEALLEGVAPRDPGPPTR
jgi:hypothetical protein